MAVSPRGSYCRDLLDASRLLDLYALLGTPLQVTLGYPSRAADPLPTPTPSDTQADPMADASLKAAGGSWLGGISADGQADWAADFLALAICKPSVRHICWADLIDAERHQFPNCGLIDRAGRAKEALAELRHQRQEHLS